MVLMRELLQTLGFRDHATSEGRSRAIFHYEPLLELYKREIPSLFGILLRDEGTFVDRTDPELFEAELEELLKRYGPLIWPAPGHGPRDHLLNPQEGSHYTSELVYPRDNVLLKQRLRAVILAKKPCPNVDVDALIEKRHQDAKRLRVKNPSSRFAAKQGAKALRNHTGVGKIQRDRQLSLRDHSSSLSTLTSTPDHDSGSEDSVVGHNARRRGDSNRGDDTFNVALRLFRKAAPEEVPKVGPCHSYGTTFLSLPGDLRSSDACFSHVCEKTKMDCRYMDFHLSEDMSPEGRIRIYRMSRQAEATFREVLNVLRNARKLPGEPSYRTIEVEVG